MKNSSFKIFLLRKAVQQQGIAILSIAIFIAIFCLPHISSFAYYQIEDINFLDKIQKIISWQAQPQKEVLKLYVTAYSSTVGQTDDTPCIAASGYNLCLHDKENVVACNFLPLGTKVIFPELDREQVYTVVDRMHERYNSRLDIWKQSQEAAKKFGLKYLTVEIYR